jgi:hypothetical protein
MAMITITDLCASRALDFRAMSSLRGGGGAPWVFGVARPFTEPSPSVLPVVNYYQITNNYTFIDQMVNQITVLDIANTGDNASITAVLVGSPTAVNT